MISIKSEKEIELMRESGRTPYGARLVPHQLVRFFKHIQKNGNNI